MMNRLLSQNWFLARRGTLWVIAGVMFVVSAWGQLEYSGNTVLPGLGVVYAFFAAEYLGEMGTSGRLDGQIIHGSSRLQVYLADFLTVLFCFWIVLGATVAGELAAAALTGALSAYNPAGWLAATGGQMLNAAAYAGLLTLAGLLLVGRQPGRGTIVLIVSICLFAAVAVWGGIVASRLDEPESLSYYEIGEVYVDAAAPSDTEEYLAGPMLNPDFVQEPERGQLDSLVRILPVTQSLWLNGFAKSAPTQETAGPLIWTYVYALLTAAGSVAVGVLLFGRRELD